MNLGGGKGSAECARNWGWSGRYLFLLRAMTERRQKRGGGGKRIVGGGSKTFLGRGFSPNLRYVFHPPEFSTPPGRSLTYTRTDHWEGHEERRSHFSEEVH